MMIIGGPSPRTSYSLAHRRHLIWTPKELICFSYFSFFTNIKPINGKPCLFGCGVHERKEEARGASSPPRWVVFSLVAFVDY